VLQLTLDVLQDRTLGFDTLKQDKIFARTIGLPYQEHRKQIQNQVQRCSLARANRFFALTLHDIACSSGSKGVAKDKMDSYKPRQVPEPRRMYVDQQSSQCLQFSKPRLTLSVC
jgi:hypothetical protein